MDFITLHRQPGQRRPGRVGPRGHGGLKLQAVVAHRFGRFKYRGQRQEAQARRIAVDTVGVDQGLAQHLQAAANAQHRTARVGVRADRTIEPLAAQPGQIGTGAFGAGQDDPVAPGLQGGQLRRAAHPLQVQAFDVFERLEFIQIADARVGQHRHRALHRAAGAAALVKHTVFLGQAVLPPHRQGGYRGHAGAFLQHLGGRRQQGRVAAKLVQHKAPDQGAVFWRQPSPGAVQMCERTSPVNIADQQTSRLCMGGHAHIDDVAVV